MKFNFSIAGKSKLANIPAGKINVKGNNIKCICAYCGKEFYVAPSYGGTHTYCSNACVTAAKKVEHLPNTKCFVCGKPIYIKPSRIARSKSGKFTCSKECMGKMRSMLFIGDKNSNYRNDTLSYYYNNGFKYQKIKVHDHPYKGFQDYYPYHRYVVEQHHELFDNNYFDIINGKYYLKKDVIVHHIDENTLNNDIANLIPYNKSEHSSAHNQYKILIKDTKGRITGVVKQGELLENHNDNDNQQPSDDSNIVEGSTTNSRGVIDNANVSNANTSALPVNNGDDIV